MAKKKKRYYGDAMYEPSERKMERRDSEMIGEDRSAIANMPQNVVYREYPKNGKYLYSQIDDGKSGIDMEQNEAADLLNRRKAKSMY